MRGVRRLSAGAWCLVWLVASPGAAARAAPAGDPGRNPASAPADPESVEEEPPAEGEAEPPTRVGCLDDLTGDGYRRKGVQKRDFIKRGKGEVAALGGFYASDLLSSTYTAAVAAAYFPSEDLGIEVLVSYAPVKFRLEAPFTAFEQTRRFVPGSALQAVAGLMFSPFHAKFKLTEATILHGDLYAVAGGGRTFHDSVQGITFQAGLGLRLALWRRLALRFDVRDFILPQEVLGRGRTTHNITVLTGLAIWLG
jgi:outer membrane beta-barrel protein